MFGSNLCSCSNAYIFISGTITIKGEGDDDAAKRTDERNKGVIFKNGVPFNDCVGNINVTQIDNAKDVDVVITEYSDNYSKALVSLRQYYKGESNDDITEYESFKSKIKITAKPPDARNTKILKYQCH